MKRLALVALLASCGQPASTDRSTATNPPSTPPASTPVVKGEKGDPGATGQAGATGDTGATGATGESATGSSSSTGSTGASGNSGTTGANGCSTLAQDDYRRVFVTTTKYTGADAAAHADEYCADAAAAVGLPGTYVAWLSTASFTARDDVKDCGPWFDTYCDQTSSSTNCHTIQGAQFVNLAALRTQPAHYVFRHESGIATIYGSIWTFSSTSGAAAQSCETELEGHYGDLAGSNWSSTGTDVCTETHSLFCIGQ